MATFGILAAACGDDDTDDAAPAETAEAAPEAAPEPEPAAEPEAAPEPEPVEEPEAAPEPAEETEPEPAAEPEEPAVVGGQVKVGMITTLSTGAAYLGEGIRDAFILAFELDGRYELDLIVEDDGRDPAFAQQLADRMLTRDEVDVMTGIVFSNVAGAVVPQVVNAGTIYISPNAAPSPFAGAQCHENYFVASWQNDNQAEAMGVYVADQGYESVVALAPNYQAGHDLVAGFKRFFGEVDEEI
ncbi:MAG: ABC transporter substrate-binding protein, partial [Acidimicrobiaceae bacterium]|nr:ABC transporter substrate-binding protein [Acidimicrobiaceae bacterium]